MRHAAHFDIIGDIHGHHDKLLAMLDRLGYRQDGGAWWHPERTAVFVGDLIDKGPAPAEVLKTVRRMVDAGSARMVVGNHELNWVRDAYRHLDRPYAFLRATTAHHDRVTLVEGFLDDPEALRDHFAWLRRQPLFIDEPGLRVVHACWNDNAIAFLKTQNLHCLDDRLLAHYEDTYSEGYLAIDLLVAGCEHEFLKAPSPQGFPTRRRRIRWWQNAAARIHPCELQPSPAREIGYPKEAPPVFFGHYALDGAPTVLDEKVVGLDYAAAYGGGLVAYRHTTGQPLDDDSFVAV